MPFFVAQDRPSKSAGARLRALLDQPGIVRMPGAYNGLSALQARGAGFEAVYLSGAALSASMGLPDLGVVTLDEVASAVRQIAHASGLPLLVDIDTGFGEALNVMNAVVRLEQAGAGAIQLEDQILPKKCGHLNDKKLADADDAAAKIAAAAKARKDALIVARTDAVASEGMDAAVARARLYLEAGADVIFPEALTSIELLREFAVKVKAPLLANMTEFGRTPFLTAAQFEELGYRIVIWPVSALRVAAKAQEMLYATLAKQGSVESVLDSMMTREELYKLIEYAQYENLDKSIIASVPPT